MFPVPRANEQQLIQEILTNLDDWSMSNSVDEIVATNQNQHTIKEAKNRICRQTGAKYQIPWDQADLHLSKKSLLYIYQHVQYQTVTSQK